MIDKTFLEETIAQGQGTLRTLEQRLAQYKEALALLKQAENLGIDKPEYKEQLATVQQGIADTQEGIQEVKANIDNIRYWLPNYVTKQEAIRTWFRLYETWQIRHTQDDDYIYKEIDEIDFKQGYKAIFTLSEGCSQPEYEPESDLWSCWFTLHPEYKALIEAEEDKQRVVKKKDASTEAERLRIASEYRKAHPKAKVIYVPFTCEELKNGVDGLDERGIRNYLNTLKKGISLGLGIYAVEKK